MVKWLIRRRLAAFERRFGYDVSYVRSVLDADWRAFFALAKIQSMTSYHRDVPRDVYHAVGVAAVLAEDCGPCTQLAVTFALQARVDPGVLRAVLESADPCLSEPVRLGVRFARAVLAHDPAADSLREAIVERWGPRALLSLGFAITSARIYPTLKYALGYGRSCQRVVVAGEPITVVRRAA